MFKNIGSLPDILARGQNGLTGYLHIDESFEEQVYQVHYTHTFSNTRTNRQKNLAKSWWNIFFYYYWFIICHIQKESFSPKSKSLHFSFLCRPVSTRCSHPYCVVFVHVVYVYFIIFIFLPSWYMCGCWAAVVSNNHSPFFFICKNISTSFHFSCGRQANTHSSYMYHTQGVGGELVGFQTY